MRSRKPALSEVERDLLFRPVTNLIPPTLAPMQMRPPAGHNEAQIRATVTAKSRQGQAIKHYIWYGLTRDYLILHTHCSQRLENG